MPCPPLAEEEIVWLDVRMDEMDAVEVFHNLNDADCKVQGQWLGHHFVACVPVQVHSIL